MYIISLYSKYIYVEGIYTHFSEADTDNKYTKNQLDIFNKLLTSLDELNLKPPIVHAANSFAIFNYPNSHFHMVRSGAALYGLIKQEGLRKVAMLKTHVTAIASLQNGDRCGYGQNKNIVSRDTWRANIALGYGDGLPRDFKPESPPMFWLNGNQVPLLCPMAMHKAALDITDVYDPNNPNIHREDEVVVFGNEDLTIFDAAESRCKIPAELLSQLKGIPIVYSLL